MDFDLSDEQRMLADSARRYVGERCSLEDRRAQVRAGTGWSPQRWADFAEMGWLALPLPEAAGGLGGGPVELALLMEALGHGLVSEPLVDSAVLCGSVLSEAGATPLLEAIATGEAVFALAHLEEGDRHPYAASVNMQAQRDGEGWQLSGHKHLVQHGASATHWLVSARPDDGAGWAFFVVKSDTPGVDVRSHRMIDGTYAADLRFDRVRLEASALVLDANRAPSALEAALDQAVLAHCAATIGSMEAVMAMTADYLKTRVQYGQPLARFQALQHRLSEMFVETDQSRAALWRAIAAVEAGDAPQRERAVSAAKWLIGRAGLFVAGQGIQLHGGIGVTDEYAVGHHYKAMVAFDKRLGDADFHLQRSSDLFA